MKITRHTELQVFQRAFELAMQVFEKSKSFPKEEMYSLTDQLRRSSRSVAANITEAWRKRLGTKQRLRVGVVWNGGFRANQPALWAANKRRNVELTVFAKALAHLEVDFYSLQKGDPAESEIRGQELTYWPKGNFYNYADELKDFSDTAALIDNLDLVIAVDTSTAHLAAAMGKPTWILNRFDTCWRWMLNRSDSPWYDSVTLYRQDDSRQWPPILEKMAGE